MCGTAATDGRRHRLLLHSTARRNRQTGEVPIWLIVVLGLFGGVLLYWYTTPNSMPTWLRGWLPSASTTASSNSDTKPVYRWEDEAGQTHITSQPPSGQPYEVIRYRTDTNAIQPEPTSRPKP